MNIKFKKIYLFNFQSFHEATVELDDRHNVQIVGRNNCENDCAKSNGSGKSSIFSAISWVLTGETVNGAKSICNKAHLDEGCLVTLECSVDGVDYKITRTKDHFEYKTNLFIYVNNENKSGKGIRDSEKLLAEYLPDLTPSLLGSIIILGQGLPQKFTNNTPSGRKEVLEKLSKSDFMIEDLKARISTRKAEIATAQRSTEDCLLKAKTTVEIQNRRVKEADNFLNNLPDKSNLEIRITELEKQLNELDYELECYNEKKRNEVEGLNKVNSDFATFNNSFTARYNEIQNKYATEKGNINREINKYREQMIERNSKMKSVSAEITKIQNIKEVCPTCHQKLIGVVKPDTSALEEELTALKQEYSTLNTSYSSLLLELEDIENVEKSELADLTNSVAQEKASFNAQISQYNSNIKTFDLKIADVQRRRNSAVAEINKCENSLNNIDTEIAMNENIKAQAQAEIDKVTDSMEAYNSDLTLLTEQAQINAKFNTLVTRDFRGYLLKDIIAYIDQKAKEYCNIVFNNQNLAIYLNGNNIDIECQGKEYASLSGGEQQKVDLIIQFAIRDMMVNYLNFSCNIIVLDEIMDFVDAKGCDNIINLIQEACKDVSSVFIITHHADLNLPCDETITIVKNAEGISSIEG